MPICRRCRRKLKDPLAIERGMGRVCWEKYQMESQQKPVHRLFNKGEYENGKIPKSGRCY